MLSASHNRAYQDFLALLIDFKNFVDNLEVSNIKIVAMPEFQVLQQSFDKNVATLNSGGIEPNIVARWQSIQTEIKREFQLLTTDILFLASARQNATQTKRIKNISDRSTKLIGYCQILLQDYK